jgi:transposase
MGHFVGLDISDATTNICIVNEKGIVQHEHQVRTEPGSILNILQKSTVPIEKVGMETGPKSNHLCHMLRKYYPTCLYDAFKVSKVLSAQVNKTDRNDAKVIAEIARIDCLSDVFDMEAHLKSEAAQETTTLIRVREDLVQQLIHIYNMVRGVCKTHGIIIPPTSQECFTDFISRFFPEMSPSLILSVKSLIAPYDGLRKSIQELDAQIALLANQNANALLLMTIPQIGPVTALYFAMLIDDPARFSHAKDAGPYFGLTPMQYSSGKQEYQGAISKRGDALMRKLLVGAARRILQNNALVNDLKKWGKKREKSLGKGRASVALARHLAVIMLAILKSSTPYKDNPIAQTKKKQFTLTLEDAEHLTKELVKTGEMSFSSLKQLEKILNKAQIK